jgi:hypothetical protein
MISIYRAGWQLKKVRALMYASLIALAFALYFGCRLVQTYGLSAADGGQLAPLPNRLAMGGLVAASGIAFAIGMGVYGRHYAARIELDPNTKQLHVDTVGFLWNDRHVIDLADIGEAQRDIDWSRWSKPDIETLDTAADFPAPWTSVRIQGWRWPVIIDQQGEVIHPELLQILFGDSDDAEDEE